MSRSVLFAGLMTLAVLGPAYAADLCTDEHMKQMDQMIAAMDDADKQKEATAALFCEPTRNS